MTNETMYKNLFQPGTIANIELKNRIMKAPQTTGMGGLDGSVTPRLIRYYKEVAMGGCAMVIVGYAYIDKKASKSCFHIAW